MNIVYNTDAKWFAFLKKEGITGDVNFWRKDSRNLNVDRNTPFYFKIRGTQLIAGRATLTKMEQMTFTKAWERFGTRNGVESFPEFVEQVCEVIHTREDDPITCLVLDSLEFLPDSNWIRISEEDFPRPVVASKFFEDNEFEHVIRAFDSSLKRQPPAKILEQSKSADQELVIPLNFRGKITISFDSGEIRIRKEGS